MVGSRRARGCLVGLLAIAACSSGPIALGRLDDSATSSIADGSADTAVDVEAQPTPDGDACTPPLPTHHYAFDGVGTDVVDLRGGPSGHALGGATLDGGVLRLDGIDDYVDLPNGILANLTEVSIAIWVRRLGGPGYTRVFDFGTGSLGEDPLADASTVGRSYLAATPSTGHTPSGLAVLMSPDGPPNEVVAASDVVLDDQMRLVVVVVSSATISLFHEGVLVARVPRVVPLAAIVDQNAWLGRSQYSADPYLSAEYADVRVWGTALSDCAVRTLYAQGPDPH
jgi:hypothetical protein